MPFRLIFVLLLVLFEAAFIGFNLENTCDVWLFKTFETVPVYITVLISFAAGALLCMIFFAFGGKRRRKASRKEGEERAAPYKEKKRRAGKGKEKGTDSPHAAPAHEGLSRLNAPESPSTPAGWNAKGES